MEYAFAPDDPPNHLHGGVGGFDKRLELLRLYVPTVVMPKRGKKNAAETAQENEKQFVALRHQHSAVESDINSLEHHGLNRCLDVGFDGYQRYAGYGILAYNLHVIGRELQAKARRRAATAQAAA